MGASAAAIKRRRRRGRSSPCRRRRRRACCAAATAAPAPAASLPLQPAAPPGRSALLAAPAVCAGAAPLRGRRLRRRLGHRQQGAAIQLSAGPCRLYRLPRLQEHHQVPNLGPGRASRSRGGDQRSGQVVGHAGTWRCSGGRRQPPGERRAAHMRHRTLRPPPAPRARPPPRTPALAAPVPQHPSPPPSAPASPQLP